MTVAINTAAAAGEKRFFMGSPDSVSGDRHEFGHFIEIDDAVLITHPEPVSACLLLQFGGDIAVGG
jgi:hypothetical protein